MTTFLSNRSIYEPVICGIGLQARERLRMVTANAGVANIAPLLWRNVRD